MKFVITNANGGTPQNLTTAFQTIIAALAQTGNLRRIRVEELWGSAAGAAVATDGPVNWDLSLVTADGTGTSSAPQPYDGPLETGTVLAAATIGKANYTSEPTTTANTSRLIVGPNQRGIVHWAALSDAHRPSSPAVANNGFTWRAKAPNYNVTVNAVLVFDE